MQKSLVLLLAGIAFACGSYGASAQDDLDLTPSWDPLVPPPADQVQLPTDVPPMPQFTPLEVIERGGIPHSGNSTMPEGPTIPLTPDTGINISPSEIGIEHDF